VKINNQLSIDEVISSNKIYTIYPNPTETSSFQINSQSNFDNPSIQIYTFDGRNIDFTLVYENAKSLAIKLPESYKGLLYIKIKNNKDRIQKSLLLK
jgi:Secretion system C-terminal sorting domain